MNFLPAEKSLDFQNYSISQSKAPKHNYIFDISEEVYQFNYLQKQNSCTFTMAA